MTQPAPLDPLEYQTETPRPRRPLVDLGTIIISALIAALLIAAILIAPRFEAIFRDFGTQLPFPTAILLRLTHADPTIVFSLIPLLAAVPIAISIPLQIIGRRILRAALYLVLLGILAWLVLALFLPYVSLLQSVSGR
jgi:type II secretory pathway component PulF